jgi:catechol 2,3-dioxygenase-like lactoylglutathione lyase family enzyme
MKPGSFIALGLLLTSLTTGVRSGAPVEVARPVLVNTCLISGRFQELVDFYQRVLGITPRMVNGSYAEFPTGAGVLAIFSADAQEQYIPGSAEPASNKSAILEFKVADVDGEFARLQPFVKSWVKQPTTQPWGTRSFYFRDPDGNLVDFYSNVKTQSVP